jgi:hypothetical protein
MPVEESAVDLFEEIGMDELLRSARAFLCSLGLLVCTFANAGSVSGSTTVDSTGNHHDAALRGGAGFSADVFL